MELPAEVSLVLEGLRDGLLGYGDLTGLYVYGSLGSGDFSAARSDIDLVAMVGRPLGKDARKELRQLHLGLATTSSMATRLHCLYVTEETAGDPAQLHDYWYQGRFRRWRLSLVGRAELASFGMAFYGPWPPPGITAVTRADLQAAVREEITGYWRRTARGRAIWRKDSWVDLGLTVLPRAAAVLATGDLITKTEAIRRLGDFGVPAELAREIRRRRDGEMTTGSMAHRVTRARLVRRIMTDGVRKLAS